MTATRISLPAEMTIEKPAGKTIRALVEYAMDRGLPPRKIPENAARERHPLRLSPMFEGQTRKYLGAREESGCQTSLPGKIAELAWAAWKDQQGSGPKKQVKPVDDPSERRFGNRPGQARYHRQIRRGLQNGRIVLAEAGTGTGKGRVLGALAAEFGPGDTGPAVVAAPTVQVIHQLLCEYLTIEDRPAASFLLGRNHFISSKALEDWLLDEDTPEDLVRHVRQWVDSGAGERSEHTRMLHQHAPELSWLAEDLAAISPLIPVADLALNLGNGASEDTGEQAYRRLRDRVHTGVPVLFVTHSMLVWHWRLHRLTEGGEGILPSIGTLLIDEAHQFSGIAEAAHSESIALRTLVSALQEEPFWRERRKLTPTRKAVSEVRAAMDMLREHAPQGAEERPLRPEEIDTLMPALNRIRKALKPLSDAPANGPGQRVQDALRLIQAIQGKNFNAWIRFSRVRSHPSLASGPRSLGGFFKDLWASVPRAALASATLYLPRRSAPPQFGLIKTSLHLPSERIDTPPSVLPAWLFTPTLMTPSAAETADFCPPQERDYAKGAHEALEAAEKAWLDRVASRLLQVADQAPGGTLVLNTSYDQIQGLAKRLEAPLGPRLIVQKRGGFRKAREQYLSLYREGLRPFWLATGPAWTGLDLKDAQVPDAEVEQDRLLTDLVIPRVPFGTERSTVHQSRQTWMKTAERDRAAFQFRQGIGRLMRRPGTRQRRLWILDGRIWSNTSPWLYAPFHAILAPYRAGNADGQTNQD